MNSLNSILIEGTVREAPKSGQSEEGLLQANLDLICYRRQEKANKQIEKQITVRIVAYGQLAGMAIDNIVQGKGLRIVGRLDADDQGLVVVAEHIEILRR